MKKLLLSVFAAGSLFAGNFANLQITNDTIMVEGQAKVSYEQPFYVRGGYLINSDKSNFFYAGVKSEGQAIGIDLPIKFSLFVDFVHTTKNSALPVGIGASSYIGQFSIPVFVRGEFEYAPKILSFDEADKFMKFKVEAGTQFIENGEVFVGYRDISFDNNYDSSLYVGVGFTF
ncbi:hypothetical protein NAMH_0105 [Nautilia profundicola AmH]|uniref:Outer membrane protein beta-barrel domain-containing protein n=1 Tax=Nautilia profundicola (strain ATCC BAA-1463 / DSM 18972 / AmH) TaxID=598659 RepID=B9L7D4_NAUPA|nr:hypothetical protein [Nautilia profundicola]ACM93160.1 hypothetical protein NAMH_0105 [Nautilia profundicola AmH]